MSRNGARAVGRLHGWVSGQVDRAYSSSQKHAGAVVWQGFVEFDLEGTRRPPACYDWEEPPEREGERVYAVLKVPPIRTAADAVRASIAAGHKWLA